MKYYKVINNREGNLSSAILPPCHEGFTKYSLEHWIGAPKNLALAGYHLFVFKNQKTARIFLKSLQIGDRRLYQCKVRGVIRNLPPIKTTRDNKFGISFEGDMWPDDTVMAREVMLIHEVQTNTKREE